MKKCPKCGTILDDSKKTCYMCGTNLSKSSFSNFGETFDKQIGAITTENQDSVFSDRPDMNSFEKEDIMKEEKQMSTFTNNSSFFKNDFSFLQNIQKDMNLEDKEKKQEKEAEEGLKKTENKKEKKRLQKEKNKKTTKFREKKEKEETPKPQKKEQKKQIEDEKNRVEQKEINENKNYEFNEEKEEEKNKKINWGNLLSKRNSKEYKNKNQKLFPLFFNLGCIVLFLGILLFGYFLFFKQQSKGFLNLGGLQYKINKEFKLKNEDSGTRYYTYGENCALRITYGPTNSTDSYIDNYLNSIKEQYEKDKNSISQYEEIKVNENVWSALSILTIVEDDTSSNGYQTTLRYKYASIINNGNFYHTVFGNPNNDKTCSSMYNEFISSLTFE